MTQPVYNFITLDIDNSAPTPLYGTGSKWIGDFPQSYTATFTCAGGSFGSGQVTCTRPSSC